jgi:aspartate racemase
MPGGLKSATIVPEALHLLRHACEQLLANEAEIIVGGCSEVQIGLDKNNVSFPFIDAMDLVARRAVAYCYAGCPAVTQSV